MSLTYQVWTIAGWIKVKRVTNIQGTQRMNPNDFGNLSVALPAGKYFYLSSEICQHLLVTALEGESQRQ